MLPIAGTIAFTGLLYTHTWGSWYFFAANKTKAFQIYEDFPKSKPTSLDTRYPIDQVVAKAYENYPGAPLGIDLPDDPDKCYVVYVSHRYGPNLRAVMAFDAYSGELLEHRRAADSPALGQWGNWNYRLHVGSVLGLPSKIVWSIACVVLMGLPVTGFWMWWLRRPPGKSGLPRPRDAHLPRGAVAVMLAAGAMLPMAGISLLVVAALEFAIRRRHRWHRRN